MSYKEICEILRDTTPETAMDVMLYNQGGRTLESRVVCYGCILSLVLGFSLLFLIPLNGVVLYRTMEIPFGLPHYSNFIVGLMAYTIYVVLRKIISDNNLFDILVGKISAFVAMFGVFLYFVFQ